MNLPKPPMRPSMPATRPAAPAPVRPAAPPARPSAPQAVPARPAAPPPKPTPAAPPAPVKPAAPPARPAAPPPARQAPPAPAPQKPAAPPMAPPPRKGGAPTQPTAVPAQAPKPATPAPQSTANAEQMAQRERGGKAQMRTWLIEFLQNDAEVQDIVRSLIPQQDQTEEAADIYAEIRDADGNINPELLMEASSTMTLEQVNGLPELLGEDGFAYPAEAKGLLARRKYIQKFLSDLQAAQDAEAQGEEDSGSEGDALEEDLWCCNEETGQWFYAWPPEDLQPGDTVCYTRDLAPEGEEPGSYGYVWLVGTIADKPTAVDAQGDVMLRLNVTADKDNREVLQPLMPEGKILKIGDPAMITWYPNTPAEDQIFQYAGRLEQAPEQAG